MQTCATTGSVLRRFRTAADIAGETLAAMAASSDLSDRGFPDIKWKDVRVEDDNTCAAQNLTGDTSII